MTTRIIPFLCVDLQELEDRNRHRYGDTGPGADGTVMTVPSSSSGSRS